MYIDYSQFEAGILAAISGEAKLIDLYNNNDIYNDLANKIFNSKKDRKEAKVQFYRYIYGDTSNKSLNEYFEQFSQIKLFKQSVTEEANSQRIISSLLGNSRKVNIDNENNWLLSHKIQSLASYI